ncbi:MAG: ATP-grasp domain-containing protein [Bacteroidales bacterium]|nr:ATP-grasp domain-containing protein [Bacteroidales bacterium]
MIILEKPYVSEFLQQTVVRLQIPVLETEFSKSLTHAREMNMLEEGVFFSTIENTNYPLIYSNSENSVELLNRFAPELRMTKNVNYFKDKSKLREIFSKLNPDVWYCTYTVNELIDLDIATLKTPFVIKPVRGFASIGIHAVHDAAEWNTALAGILQEVKIMQHVFPDVVVSLNEFLIERYIEGTEIAIDAYFNRSGEPVILNILTHLFGSKLDMSDRLYMTSDEVVRKYHDPIIKYLEEIARLTDLRNFPFHFEMRQESNGNFVPIEINPMRFMGFCVADVEYYFYGINPYEYYFHQKKPDWDKILGSRSDKLYGMFGIDIPKHLDKSRIRFDYEKFIAHFSKVLHHVKMDYIKFPMAIYLFAEVPKDQFSEFEVILYSDLYEFIIDDE